MYRFLLPAFLALLAACSGRSSTGAAFVHVGFHGDELSAADVAAITINVLSTDSGAQVYQLQKGTNGWSATLSGIRAGTARTFHGDAYDAQNNIIYSGDSAPVDIAVGQTVQVTLLLQQKVVPPPPPFSIPVIDSMVLSTNSVHPGDTINLAASAHDPRAGTLTYLWSADGGTFLSNGQTAKWQAVVAGTFHLTVTVTNAAGSSASLTAPVTVVPNTGSAAVTIGFNNWPVVTAMGASPGVVIPGQQVTLSATAHDDDSDPVAYSWSSGACTGTFDTTSGATVHFTLPSNTALTPVSCTFTVSVNDGRGGANTATLTLGAEATAVQPDISPQLTSATQSASTIAAPGTVQLAVAATSPTGRPLSFHWTATRGTFSGEIDNSTNGTSSIAWSFAICSSNTDVAQVTVSDDWGGSVTTQFTLLEACPVQPWMFPGGNAQGTNLSAVAGPTTRKQLWSASTPQGGWGLGADETVYAPTNFYQTLTGFDPVSGAQTASITCWPNLVQSNAQFWSPTALPNGALITAHGGQDSTGHIGYALSAVGASACSDFGFIQGANTVFGGIVPAPDSSFYVYMNGAQGHLQAYDSARNLRWDIVFGQVSGAVLSSDASTLYLTMPNQLVAVRTSDHATLATASVSNVTATAVANGTLVFGGLTLSASSSPGGVYTGTLPAVTAVTTPWTFSFKTLATDIGCTSSNACRVQALAIGKDGSIYSVAKSNAGSTLDRLDPTTLNTINYRNDSNISSVVTDSAGNVFYTINGGVVGTGPDLVANWSGSVDAGATLAIGENGTLFAFGPTNTYAFGR